MAKNTLAQVSEKLLAVRSQLAAGKTAGDACRAAGLSPGTYKKWLVTYAGLDLPRWVVEAPAHGAFALSLDGRSVFTVAESPRGYALTRRDAATGAETARGEIAEPRGAQAYREALAATADASGERLRFVTTGGGLYGWDVPRDEAAPLPRDLRGRCIELSGRAMSGARRWAYAGVSPDLSLVAYWERLGASGTDERAALCVRRIDDDVVVLRYELPPLFIPPPLVFHPTRPLLALLDDNKLTTLLDLDRGVAIVERGPQAHAVSFSTGDTVLFDDWYGNTQEFDWVTGETRVLGRGWGALASQRARYVNGTEQSLSVRSRRDPGACRAIAFEKIAEYQLSLDGACLAVLADRLCVWDLGPSEP